mmetsp:Transcript_20762/g.27004  ORF Transcript_20762/g.27004 Transcript_20762/m.27004 type:complete len:154 (+) Transcript_20762:92-553(+)
MFWPFSKSSESLEVSSNSSASQDTQNEAMTRRNSLGAEEKIDTRRWLSTELERKRIVEKLSKLHYELEKQNKELNTLVKEAEDDRKTAKLRIGNLASLLLLDAEVHQQHNFFHIYYHERQFVDSFYICIYYICAGIMFIFVIIYMLLFHHHCF